jgi:hypothetical protein
LGENWAIDVQTDFLPKPQRKVAWIPGALLQTITRAESMSEGWLMGSLKPRVRLLLGLRDSLFEISLFEISILRKVFMLNTDTRKGVRDTFIVFQEWGCPSW